MSDAGQARYAENRKACRKPYQALECKDFLCYIEETMIQKGWSVDAAVGKARKDESFRKTLSTRTLYQYIDLGLLRIKNHHLPLKLRRKTKERVLHRNKKVLGNSMDHSPEHIKTREEFGHWELGTVIGAKSRKDTPC